MAFQRSYSKVWWDSDTYQNLTPSSQLPNTTTTTTTRATIPSTSNITFNNFISMPTTNKHQNHYYFYQQQQQQKQHSIDYYNLRDFTVNLSGIQEDDDDEQQKKQQQQNHHQGQQNNSNISSKLCWGDKRHSPGSLRSQDSGFSDNDESSKITNNSNNVTPESSPKSEKSTNITITPPTVIRKVGKSHFYSPLISVSRRISFTNKDNETESELEELDKQTESTEIIQKQKRRRRVSRKLGQTLKDLSKYQNETINLDTFLKANDNSNNQDISFLDTTIFTNLQQQQTNPLTSTPNKCMKKNNNKENILCNREKTPALENWLYELRGISEPEVLSTLQTKSIAQEAFKNLTITTNTVTKLIRQLQQRAMYLQHDFERISRLLSVEAKLEEALHTVTTLLTHVQEFTFVLERRGFFFSDTREQRHKYEDQLEQIRIVIKDTQYSIAKQHYINIESLLDDVQVLKRSLLIIMRMLFDKLVRIIVQSIENSRCDLLLRANINMIATLTNIDYDGLASLTDAIVQNETVRAILLVCLDHRLSSVRALGLRALATICSEPTAIQQLSSCGGIEIIRDILYTTKTTAITRTDIERREAVSLLTQITAPWHGTEHRVKELRDCIEAIVAGLTLLIVETSCPQTLLLCAAALNNFTRIEITSHYSIMSNETISKLIESVDNKQNTVSIFLYEQIITMLYNMSLNKKCHSHLANSIIINFITSAYEAEFSKCYNSRAETDAQERCIKAILHTLTRLVQESHVLGINIPLPTLFLKTDSQYHQPNKYIPADSDSNSNSAIKTGIENTSPAKFNLTRYESYV